MIGRFYVCPDKGPDGNAIDRYAIFDTLGDWPACKTIGTGEDDERFTMLTREEAERRADELNAAHLDRKKAEEGHTLLSKVMEDVGHLVPYRAMVEFWLEANDPERVRGEVAA